MSKIDHSLFHADEHALQNAYGDCPQCQSKLQIRSGKSGPFIGCSQYPACHFSKPLHEHESQQLTEIAGSSCPQCGSSLAVKKGRYGLFIGCTDFPNCHHIEKVKEHKQTSVICPSCGKGHLESRQNRYGKTFYACNQYPSCKYLVNMEPAAESCPACGWGIMLKKNGRSNSYLQCPQRGCGHKMIIENEE